MGMLNLSCLRGSQVETSNRQLNISVWSSKQRWRVKMQPWELEPGHEIRRTARQFSMRRDMGLNPEKTQCLIDARKLAGRCGVEVRTGEGVDQGGWDQELLRWKALHLGDGWDV